MEIRSIKNYSDSIQFYLDTKFCGDGKVTEKCIIAVGTYVNLNWERHFSIVSLIKKNTSHAVAIFTCVKLAGEIINDIRVQDVIPLNLEFRFVTDRNRISSDNTYHVVLSGENSTIIDFDPLCSTANRISSDSVGLNRKNIQLDFSKEDFETFSDHLADALLHITKEELYSSFDWIQRLKDDVSSGIADKNEITNLNSSYPKKKPFNDLRDRRIATSNLFPIHSTNSTNFSSSTLHRVGLSISNNISDQSMTDGGRRSVRSISTKTSFDHHQSSPDLLSGIYDELPSRPLMSSNSSNDGSQFAYIENKLRQKESEYCTWEDHTLFVGTWNVNGKVDDSLCLDDWLSPATNNVKVPSFYVLGLQEIDLSIGSVALNRGNSSSLEDRWIKLIENSRAFRTNAYRRLYRFRMAGILLIVFVDQRLSHLIQDSDVSANKVPTGMFNVMGNKGAVGIRFRILNSKLCFINCHLAAGESNRLRRDQDFRDIERNMVFLDECGKNVSIYDHDLVFLMGDLNYRILTIDADYAKDLAYSNKIEQLLLFDELITLSKSVFKKFSEGKINFLPTYKFDPNTDDYDTSEKNRVPSFCDRIMWLGKHCTLIDYSSHMSLRSSDHKPVSALFNVGLKKVDAAKRLKVQDSIIRSMDLVHNLRLPQAKINKQDIFFEDVHFYENRQDSITITNIGHYEFMFNFKDAPECPKIPDWLVVQPSEGNIKTGETCELVFEVFINGNNISDLSTSDSIQCILVLMLQGGKDYFISVTLNLVPTCFGLPLGLLVSLRDPISTFSRKELSEKCQPFLKGVSVNEHSSDEFTTPKEIYVMVDYIQRNINEEELFARPGSHNEIQIIREQLDVNGNKADFSDVCVHSVIETLLIFLKSLYLPIIPSELAKGCMAVCNDFPLSVKIISKFPTDNKNLFVYLTTFLRRVLDNSSRNGTDVGSLGILFLELFFRRKNVESSEREMCTQFIKQFLVNDPAIYFRHNRPLP